MRSLVCIIVGLVLLTLGIGGMAELDPSTDASFWDAVFETWTFIAAVAGFALVGIGLARELERRL